MQSLLICFFSSLSWRRTVIGAGIYFWHFFYLFIAETGKDRQRELLFSNPFPQRCRPLWLRLEVRNSSRLPGWVAAAQRWALFPEVCVGGRRECGAGAENMDSGSRRPAAGRKALCWEVTVSESLIPTSPFFIGVWYENGYWYAVQCSSSHFLKRPFSAYIF